MDDFLIENICNSVVVLRLARSEADFCVKWLDRGEGYMRTLRFRGLQPSSDALAECANKLGYYADAFLASDRLHSVHTGHSLQVLQHLCEAELRKAAQSKWQRYSVH